MTQQYIDRFAEIDQYCIRRTGFKSFGLIIGTRQDTQKVIDHYQLNANVISHDLSLHGSAESQIYAQLQNNPKKLFWAQVGFNVKLSLFYDAVAVIRVDPRGPSMPHGRIIWSKNRAGSDNDEPISEPTPLALADTLPDLRPLKQYDFLPPPTPEYQASVSRWTDMDNDW